MEQEQQSSRYSQETIDLIIQGIRPEGMPFEEFKRLRAYSNKMKKTYLKGNMFHQSSWIEPVEGTKYYTKKTKTYIKPEEDGK